ncbi:MAG: ABC-F family ATP-binding cassette domain-containing protein, partial [Acetanaerobacterium sp.]
KKVLDGVCVAVEDKSRIGFIGANGAGKSTLLGIITGKSGADEGTVTRASGLSIGFLEQNSGLDRSSTLYDEMLSVFAPLLALQNELHELELQMSGHMQDSEQLEKLSAQYAKKQTAFEHGEGYLIEVKIKTILNGMGFGQTARDTAIASLSGGEKTRLAMARLLLEEPNLLILDEPTNHLDFKTLMWLEEYLGTYNGAIVVVSHDRYFLDKVVSEVWELERCKLTSYPGNYSKYLQLKEERLARLKKDYEQQQKQIASLQDYIDRNMARASTSNSAKGRLKALDKIEVMEKPAVYEKHMTLRFEADRPPYKDLLEIEDLSLAVGEGPSTKQLFTKLYLSVKRGERVAVIGANGVGKTTLLKAIQGLIPIRDGSYRWGQNAVIGYYEQENANLHHEKTALNELWDRFPTRTEYEMRSALGRVLLTGENVYKRVGVLSGGEQAKLSFANLMLTRTNVLILDEPTNHLDLLAKEDLERALTDYEGTLLFVSHDRYLLNRVPTKIVELHTDGARIYNGNFDFYMSEISREKEDAAKTQSNVKSSAARHEGYFKSREQKSLE